MTSKTPPPRAALFCCRWPTRCHSHAVERRVSWPRPPGRGSPRGGRALPRGPAAGAPAAPSWRRPPASPLRSGGPTRAQALAMRSRTSARADSSAATSDSARSSKGPGSAFVGGRQRLRHRQRLRLVSDCAAGRRGCPGPRPRVVRSRRSGRDRHGHGLRGSPRCSVPRSSRSPAAVRWRCSSWR